MTPLHFLIKYNVFKYETDEKVELLPVSDDPNEEIENIDKLEKKPNRQSPEIIKNEKKTQVIFLIL